MRTLPLFILVILSLSGCATGSGADASATDAGARDAGAARVDGGRRDGGPRIDGGRDAGAVFDGAVPSDAAGSDAGEDTDAGGGPTDAGPPFDAGPAPIPSETCAGDPGDATRGGTFLGTTVGAADDLHPEGCIGPSISEADVVYVLRPLVATDYEITVVPLNGFDPMLYAGLTCEFDDNCLDAVVLNGPGEQEQITVPVEAGQTAYVVVDGQYPFAGGPASGPYQITFTLR